MTSKYGQNDYGYDSHVTLKINLINEGFQYL
jgi:hypothetical protein